jgi:hypothetical protein
VCVCVCVSTPEVTRRNYPSLPVLQQTATCAVIGSNNTQHIIVRLKTTLSVVLIGVEKQNNWALVHWKL